MLEKVSLFESRRDFFHFIILSFVIFALSLSYEFYNYKELTKFDSQLLDALVLKQYTKTKIKKNTKFKSYQVLKLKSDDGFTFYSTASKKLQNLTNRKVQLEVWAGKISFYEYMHGFYAFSKILKIYDAGLKNRLNSAIAAQHSDANITQIYQALYSAKQLPYELQTTFSKLGISHLIAISGFHLGVLSGVLFFLLKFPYRFLQNRYFPYRSFHRDTFFIITFFLLLYLLFLDAPPSLLRAFVMLLIAFILYDRGVEILSMQTLTLTIILILALFPRLIFSLGLWLSVAGVFYIFLFLMHFEKLSQVWQFFLLPLWVYLMMLPYSLLIFANFTLYHPLSILWSTLFTLFYPLSIFLHLIHLGGSLDPLLMFLLSLETQTVEVTLSVWYLLPLILLSLMSIYKKVALYTLLSLNIALLLSYLF